MPICHQLFVHQLTSSSWCMIKRVQPTTWNKSFLGAWRGKDLTFAFREILKSVQQIHRQHEMQTTLKTNVSVIMVQQVGGNFVI